MRRVRWTIGSLALAALGSTAVAQGPAPPAAVAVAGVWFHAGEAPALGSLLALAGERSPRLAGLDAEIAARERSVAPAGALPNPMVEARLANMGLDAFTVGVDDMSMLEIGVRQPLPYPGKRAARRAVAMAEVEVGRAERSAAARELAFAVARVYARLFALDAELRLLDDAHELLELMAATVAVRYGTGEGEQEAVLKVQLSLAQHDDRREAVARERSAMAAELIELLDLPAVAPIGTVWLLPGSAPPPPGWLEAAVESGAELQWRRRESAVAEREIAMAQLDLRPDFAAAGGLGYRGDFDPALLVGLAVELPFFRRERERPLLEAAGERLRAARAGEREAAARARASATRLAAAWQRLAAQIRLHDEAILPQSSATLDAARSSYLSGRSDLATVLEDYGLWLEARVRRAVLEAERFIARAEIAALVGEPLAGGAAAEGAKP